MSWSTYFADKLGIKNNCFSFPVAELDREGSIRYLHLQVNQGEQVHTAASIKNYITLLLPDDA